MKTLVLVLISFLLIGCIDNNPLVGKWQATRKVVMINHIEFTKDKSIYAGMYENVQYEINDNTVLVTGAMGIGTIYNIIDDNTMSVDMPLVGKIIYKKIR